MSDIKFSIILPVYNVADCLEECLNSLLEQTNKDFEIICVNDGSTDNSLEILEKYQDKFQNYQIITQENKGLAEARNTGYPYAKGEYICYIDSDDFVVPDFFECLNSKTKSEPDVIIFGAKTYYSISKKTKIGQYTSKNFPAKFDINNPYKFHPICWNKIYKRSFLEENNLKFKNIRISEDQLFFVQIILLAKRIEILKKDLYIYRKQRGNSLTGKKKKTDFSPIENFNYIKEFIESKETPKSLKQKILSRNLQKALSRYPKCDDKIKSEYFKKAAELLDKLKAEPEKFWWNYFSLKENQSYIGIKLEYLKSVAMYKLFCRK
ncbi:MAG: glycosyltransferase [Muribaculaceae bacterium]|nr:glycosyltransferase [Muribaculaceae bacterium]